MSNFEIATKHKYRFESDSGLLTVEDLWDLPLTAKGGRTSLDSVAKNLYKKLNENEVSFVEDRSNSDTKLERMFDIVKHVIETRKAEAEATRKRQETAARNRRIRELIERKKDEKLENLEVEELEKLLEEGA